jgi:hypothetical protein
MIDRRRAVSIFGVSVLILSLVSFGVPVPVIQDDGTPEKSESVDGIHTSYDVEIQTTDGYMTQDARALACGGLCVAGVIALSAGTAGTVIGANYFSSDVTDQSSAYYAAESLKDRIQKDYSTLNSSYEATRTMAYRVAETSFAEAMANGSTKTEAQIAADEAVTEYLADTIEDEFVRRNNAYVSTAKALAFEVGWDSPAGTLSSVGYQNVTVFPSSSESRTFNMSYIDISGSRYSWYSDDAISSLSVSFSSDSYSTVEVQTKMTEFQALSADYADIRGEVSNEIADFTDSVSESQYENLSADEVVSPVNQALEWGEDYNETGSSGYASALASSLGYAVNETGTVYSVKMPASSSTWYNGTVYADESTIPNGTITTGKVYNGTSTTAYVATSSGTTTLDQDWKVVDIETRTGESLNETALSTWSRDELNASAPLETLEKWQELKEEAQSGGGGVFPGFGGDGPLGIPLIAWLLIALLVGAVVVGDD